MRLDRRLPSWVFRVHLTRHLRASAILSAREKHAGHRSTFSAWSLSYGATTGAVTGTGSRRASRDFPGRMQAKHNPRSHQRCKSLVRALVLRVISLAGATKHSMIPVFFSITISPDLPVLDPSSVAKSARISAIIYFTHSLLTKLVELVKCTYRHLPIGHLPISGLVLLPCRTPTKQQISSFLRSVSVASTINSRNSLTPSSA